IQHPYILTLSVSLQKRRNKARRDRARHQAPFRLLQATLILAFRIWSHSVVVRANRAQPYDGQSDGPLEPAAYSSSGTEPACQASKTGSTIRQHSSAVSPRTDQVGSPSISPSSTSP